MDVYGLLIGTAQIAITIAGFGAVATSLAARGEDGWKDASRMVIMLSYSLGGAIAALAPCALTLFDIPEEWVWRASAIFVLAISLGFAPWQISRLRRAVKGGVPFLTMIPNVVLTIGMITAYGLCIFNIPAGNLAASFFAGLYASLAVSAILLFRIAYSMLLPAKPD